MSNHPMPASAARRGDTFVILAPDESELAKIHHMQRSLQTHFCGQFTTPVHVTYQRFSSLPRTYLNTLIESLQDQVPKQPALAVTGQRLEIIHSPFHRVDILKCQIEITTQLEQLGVVIQQVLIRQAIQSHYPTIVSDHVTLLNDVKPLSNQRDLTAILPQSLFLGCQLLISVATGVNQFDLIARIPLSTA